MKLFHIRATNKDRRKSLQPRSFPLLRRKNKEIVSRDERMGKERRIVSSGSIESASTEEEFLPNQRRTS